MYRIHNGQCIHYKKTCTLLYQIHDVYIKNVNNNVAGVLYPVPGILPEHTIQSLLSPDLLMRQLTSTWTQSRHTGAMTTCLLVSRTVREATYNVKKLFREDRMSDFVARCSERMFAELPMKLSVLF